jgi:hypothetical protein
LEVFNDVIELLKKRQQYLKKNLVYSVLIFKENLQFCLIYSDVDTILICMEVFKENILLLYYYLFLIMMLTQKDKKILSEIQV